MTGERSNAIYLDHNATTPIDPNVFAAMEPFLKDFFGNPSSSEHEHGNVVAGAVDLAREQVAELLNARAQEILFTSGCTEANNLAILGVARAEQVKRHMVTSAIEHPAVLEPMRALERQGWRVTYIPVDSAGRVSIESVEEAIEADTALVSVMAANNEVGTLQPTREIGSLCAARGVLFHCDLAQVTAYEAIDVQRDNIHLASISAHKAYGPKGVGALYVRSRRPRVRLAPIMFGGGQERGMRSGTLNAPAIVGFGEAMSQARRKRGDDAVRLRSLTAQFLSSLRAELDGVHLNGHEQFRIPSNLSLSIDGVEPLALIRHLRGSVSFSASSACATDKMETSHVLLAMFGDTSRARQAFRISPGRYTSQNEMAFAAGRIVEQAKLLRRSAA